MGRRVLVYDSDKQGFLHDIDSLDIEELIRRRLAAQIGHGVGEAEVRSWRESLGHMASVLRDDEIPADSGVAVEFRIPQSAKRIDVTLTGFAESGGKSAVIVELKQWEHAKATHKDAIVETFLGHGHREVTHPSYQAWSYATLLEGFNEAVHGGGISLHPCAYLHNYRPDGELDSPFYAEYLSRAPLFLRGADERARLRTFIKRHVRRGDGRRVLHELANGRIRPSKALADSLAGLMRGNAEFVLIDDQKEVYEAVLSACSETAAGKRKVIIVQGGPGTGKSVVAINLLTALTRKELSCQYVSKNAAPRKVYETRLTGTITRTRFSNLFTGSGGFVDTGTDAFDVLIVDEAHRLVEKGGLYSNLGVNQIQELIAASKCAVFFIDEDQRVTLNDIGSKEAIRAFAKRKGVGIEEYELASQFRCSGSTGYLAWLDHALGIRATANEKLGRAEFDFRVFDSPAELHAAIESRNGENRSRVVAGYCWPWASRKDPKAWDIVIGEDYRRRWNLDSDGSLWIIGNDSVNEVGCIHTCQGLEVDYIGVIVGPDLVVRDGTVRTQPDRRAKQDKTIRGYKKKVKSDPARAHAEVDLIIKNTYRTLMTRGMKGCYVYCTDPETAKHFRQQLGP